MADRIDWAAVDRVLTGLVTGEFSSVSLTWNDLPGPNYQTVRTMFDDSNPPFEIDWVSDDERDRAFRANSMWVLQWYPRSPVAFNQVAASSLVAIARWLVENDWIADDRIGP